jgi:hypothetical protein
VTFQPPSREQLKAKAERLQNLADLIQEYPAEAQLIMAAIEKGLAIGPPQIVENPSPIVIRLDESGELHGPE